MSSKEVKDTVSTVLRNVLLGASWKQILVIIFITTIVIFGIVYTVKQFNNLKNEVSIQKRIILQTKQAYKELQDSSMSQSKTATARIEVLQRERDKWYISFIKYKIKVEELKKNGEAVLSTGEDNKGKFAQVNFKSDNGIIYTEGFTKYYFDPLVLPIYSITSRLNPIEVYSRFYLDKDAVWKLNTYTTTKGVVLNNIYDIDSSFYTLFKDLSLSSLGFDITTPIKYTEYYPLGLRFKLNGGIKSWLEKTVDKVFFVDISAELYWKFLNITWQPSYKRVSIGIFYDLNFHKLISTIF